MKALSIEKKMDQLKETFVGGKKDQKGGHEEKNWGLEKKKNEWGEGKGWPVCRPTKKKGKGGRGGKDGSQGKV